MSINDFRRVMNSGASRLHLSGNGSLQAVPLQGEARGRFGVHQVQDLSPERDIATREAFVASLHQEYGASIGDRLSHDFGLESTQPLGSYEIQLVMESADTLRANAAFDDILQILPQSPDEFYQDLGLYRDLQAQLHAFLAPLESIHREGILNGLRLMVNDSGLPRFVQERAHDLIDSQDRQVSHPDWAQLGPSLTYVNGADHVVNRGISEIVMIGDLPYTTVYTTVYQDALTEETPQYKDVGQDENGQILIHTGSGVTREKEGALWVSFGRPYRQLKWLEKYEAQGQQKGHDNQPLLRSFLIPLDVANEISSEAITEHGSRGLGRDLNVDKHYEANQFGIVNPESLALLREHALPGSLRTYTDDVSEGAPSWGEVVPAAALREDYGIPQDRIPGFNVFTNNPRRVGQAYSVSFTQQKHFKAIADKLTSFYAFYTDNPALFPSDVEPDQSLPYRFDAFLRDHKPAAMDVDDFMELMVKPWASQARLALEISENYEDLVAAGASPQDFERLLNFDNGQAVPRVGRNWSREQGDSAVFAGLAQLGHAWQDNMTALLPALESAAQHDLGVHAGTLVDRLTAMAAMSLDSYPMQIGQASVLREVLPRMMDDAEDIYGELTALRENGELPDGIPDEVISILENVLLLPERVLFDESRAASGDVAQGLGTVSRVQADRVLVSGEVNRFRADFETELARFDQFLTTEIRALQVIPQSLADLIENLRGLREAADMSQYDDVMQYLALTEEFVDFVRSPLTQEMEMAAYRHMDRLRDTFIDWERASAASQRDLP